MSVPTFTTRIWRYQGFGQDAPIESGESVNLIFQLRGGWSLNGSGRRDFVRFDRARYEGYRVVHPGGAIEECRCRTPRSTTRFWVPGFRCQN